MRGNSVAGCAAGTEAKTSLSLRQVGLFDQNHCLIRTNQNAQGTAHTAETWTHRLSVPGAAAEVGAPS
jgi:hypothetical protein